MRIFSKITILAFLAVFLVAGSSFSLPMNERPINPLGTSAEPGLQEIFDTVMGEDVLDAITDQSPVALWAPGAEGDTAAYTVSMFTAGSGSLGIYGADGTTQTLLTLNNDGYPYADGGIVQKNAKIDFYVTDYGIMVNNTIINGDFSTYGFYWNNSFTEDDKNVNDAAKALSYLVEDGTTLDLNAYGNNSFFGSQTALGNNDWILAFEDGSDNDFQDAIFYMEDMATPTPEPATLFLLGSGLLGFAGSRRRKAKK